MRDESWKRHPRQKPWDSPEKSKERVDTVRRMVAKKKQARNSCEKQIPNPSPGRPHPFSEEELNEFQVRSQIRVQKMIESIEKTVEDHEKPRSKRKLV